MAKSRRFFLCALTGFTGLNALAGTQEPAEREGQEAVQEEVQEEAAEDA